MTATLTAMDCKQLNPTDTFARRHIGPNDNDMQQMLKVVGFDSLDAMVDATVPKSIRMSDPLTLDAPASSERGETELIEELRAIANENKVFRSCIGMGYYDCITPPVIQRNILESPGWYTQYTPYQAEIAQGRLEALLNFQTMVSDLTGLPLSNSSLLDEATAAAEAMAMSARIARNKSGFFVSNACHPQTIHVVKTRAESMGIDLVVGDLSSVDFEGQNLCGVLVQYPDTNGKIDSPDELQALADRAHATGALLSVATDLLALTLIKPPGEFGADIAIGSAQRFGVPMGFGGPHAAFMSTSEKHARKMPGRIVGVSKDSNGRKAYRLAIQTREQHIRRDKATSNICTAQVLLAIMAGLYGVYHGPKGLRDIATRVHTLTRLFADALAEQGHEILNGDSFFDTLRVRPVGFSAQDVINSARDCGWNLRDFGDDTFGISFDETTSLDEIRDLALDAMGPISDVAGLMTGDVDAQSGVINRESVFMTHEVFNSYHSETELLRYIYRLQSRDLSLATTMISLGSCTMKLNATSEMIPVTWPAFGGLHPYVPEDQSRGYSKMMGQLEDWLSEITGFAAVSLQPNAGSQGEYAGLLAIRGYHESRGDMDRLVCLIPVSAHGTNPASAVIAGFQVVPVDCDPGGDIDVEDLKEKAEKHRDRLGALMITYPSTHGVFEEAVQEICHTVHDNGGQVYMDGANLNAQVGLCRPGDIGADVCHLNLHKTFCIPHGGGGPGMGPIAVAEHLKPFLPSHPVTNNGPVGAVSAAPYGSPSILPISWVYIALMGGDGLTKATQVAILNANYMAKRLEDHYPVLFRGANGCCAHEFIIDCRQFKVSAAIEVEDIAKRLMDYGFHAPTMSFPVAGTLMIEPTESESKAELDRFCDTLISIRQEIREVEEAKASIEDNVLKNAPHSVESLTANHWSHPYSREQAAFPAEWLRQYKFWPPVGRIDNPYGDRNLMCTCPPMESFAEGCS